VVAVQPLSSAVPTANASQFSLLHGAAPPTINAINPDPLIGRRLFVDGIVRLVFLDDTGEQYIIDLDGHTRLYGEWLRPDDGVANAPLFVSVAPWSPLR
jgi:hypothetical protein